MFSSKNGAVFEEVSTTHYKNDSFYDDQKIMESTNRKTQMTLFGQIGCSRRFSKRMKDKKKQEITIAWDVDDVLNSLTTEWFAQYKKEHNISLAFTDLTSNPPHNLLGIRKQEYLDSLDKFRAQHLMDLPPNSEMLFWF